MAPSFRAIAGVTDVRPFTMRFTTSLAVLLLGASLGCGGSERIEGGRALEEEEELVLRVATFNIEDLRKELDKMIESYYAALEKNRETHQKTASRTTNRTGTFMYSGT